MNEKLQSIFVPEAVARLAKEKGFDEWCACVFVPRLNEYFPNMASSHDFDYVFDYEFKASNNIDSNLDIPTHFQLIKWLKDKHDIDVQMNFSGFWNVIISSGAWIYDLQDNNDFEINEALELALKQVQN